MLHQDLQRNSIPLWGYFCQISDSTTSYGSYSGAVPNEKITWGKLGVNTPKSGVQIQKLIEDTYRTPPKVIDRLRKITLH